MSTYALKTGKHGSRALDLQESRIGVETREHMLKAGPKKGMHVWELGCGNGATTIDLARIVGESGSVTAIDQSSDQLQRVKEKAQDLGLKNIETKQLDIEIWEPSENRADFVCGRYVLMHLKNPRALLRKIFDKVLKKGGKALFIEGSHRAIPLKSPFLMRCWLLRGPSWP